MDSETLLQLVSTSLEALKATDIKVLDVKTLTDMTDYMVIATGRSDRQVRAIVDNVALSAKRAGHPAFGIEGEREGQWVLIDLIDVVVHIMQSETRELYQLEKLWSISLPGALLEHASQNE